MAAEYKRAPFCPRGVLRHPSAPPISLFTTTRSYTMHTLIRSVHACTHRRAFRLSPFLSPISPFSLRFFLPPSSLFSPPLSVSMCGPRGFVGRDAARCARATREILIKIREGPPPPTPPTSQPHRRELRRYSDGRESHPTALSSFLLASPFLAFPVPLSLRLSLLVSFGPSLILRH